MDQVFTVHPELTVRLGADQATFVIHMVELLQLDRLLYVGYYEPKDDAAGEPAALRGVLRPTPA